MAFNVPRLGASAGYIHKISGQFMCDGEVLAEDVEARH